MMLPSMRWAEVDRRRLHNLDGIDEDEPDFDDEGDYYEREGPWDAGYAYGTLEDDYSEDSSA